MITNRRDFNIWRTQYERIKEDFCANCKYRKQAAQGCSHFFFGNAVCLNFQWASQAERKEYEEQVLNNQAVTIWLQRNKTLDEIYKMSQKELRSVLTKKHYEQFVREEQEAKELLARLISEELTEATKTDVKSKPTVVKQNKETILPAKKKPAVKQTVNKPEVKKSPAPFTNQGLLKKRPQPDKKLEEMAKRVKERMSDATVIIASTPTMSYEEMTTLPTTHYFYCNKGGKEVVYRRSIQAKGYEQEVINFRKYLAKQGIEIIKEERR